MPRHQVLVPNLGVGDQPVKVSLWLVDRGMRVSEGEPLVEVLAGAAVVDLPSPAEGVLVKKMAFEDDRLEIGQCVGIVESEDD